jgi:hypothetical protein
MDSSDREYDRGAAPCRYCQTGYHKACRGFRLDGTVCSCECPTTFKAKDGRKKFERGDTPCKPCSIGDHRRCKRGECSCSCKERPPKRKFLFDIPKSTQ